MAVGLGCGVVAGALAWTVGGDGGTTSEALGTAIAWGVGTVAVLAAIGQLYGRVDRDVAEPLVTNAPERTTLDREVAGRSFAEELRAASSAARRAGNDEEGIEAVRETLRATLVDVLRRAGDDPESIERAIERGTWTDDPVAAATLSDAVDPPAQGIARRLIDWLRPGRAVRRRARRATGAIAATATERLPAVPGRGAPRPVSVARPSLDELRRAADGSLEKAVDPSAVASGNTADDGRGGQS